MEALKERLSDQSAPALDPLTARFDSLINPSGPQGPNANQAEWVAAGVVAGEKPNEMHDRQGAPAFGEQYAAAGRLQEDAPYVGGAVMTGLVEQPAGYLDSTAHVADAFTQAATGYGPLPPAPNPGPRVG